MKKNIAFVLPYVPKISAGGVIVVFQYATALVKNGHNVTIYFKTDMIWANKSLRYPDFIRESVGKFATYISPNWYDLDSRICKRPLFSIKDVRSHDVIIATGIETADLVARLPKESGRKYYLIQDYENWGFSDQEVNQSYMLGMENIVISKWLSDLIANITGVVPHYVPDGIDTNVFNKQKSLELRKKHSIVFHYRSDECKGCRYALETIDLLKDKYEDLNVTVIGKEKKADCIPTWMDYYENISLEEVAKLNNENIVFLCSSVKEGFGLPGLEAMACGCILCTTDYLGGKEYAVDGYNALVSQTEDAYSMYLNIDRVFSNNDLQNELSKNGLLTANKFSLKKSSEKFIELITRD